MDLVLFLFLFGLFIILFNYGGYALLARLLTPASRKKEHIPEFQMEQLPSITLIVAAYNEAYLIEEKIENTLSLQFPPGKAEFIFITDGSTDQTPEIISRFPAIKLMHKPLRAGKSAALNRAVREAKNEILVFCDANTILNDHALVFIAKHYLDPKCGGVSGEKKIYTPHGVGTIAGNNEGLYWKYESLLKKIDSDFETVVGAAGELFSLRKKLFEYLDPDTILDDFVLSLKVAQKGYRYIYEPKAFAMELPSFSLSDEKKRKIRIAAGGFQAISQLTGLLKFWRHPRLTYLYISHRVLRWAITPFCLPIVFLLNLYLAITRPEVVFQIILTLQTLFYCLAIIGGILKKGGIIGKWSRIANYFIFMNISVYYGLFRFLRKSQSPNWEKARRVGEIS